MTISGRDLMKTFGAAACAICWLRKSSSSWEWRRKLAAMLIVAALATVAGEAETQSARDGRMVKQAHAPAPVTARTEQNALDAYGKMALAFVPNAGQTDPRVRYSAQASGASFYFTPGEAVFAFTKEKKGLALRLSFLGANPAPQIEGARRGAGRINYMIGSDPARWRTGLATYEEIVYRDLWPGIDLAFRGENGELKYEFHLAPGADPRDIRLAYRGAERLALGMDGELLIHTAFGVLRDSQPVSYQEIAGDRVPVASQYSLEGSSYGIVPGPYDPNRPLVIDPGLAYSTFLGGGLAPGTGQDESGRGIAVDASGSAYVIGHTGASNFPTTVGAFDTTLNVPRDVFVTKLNPQGSALEYSTYLGGSRQDEGAAIAVDAAGNAYVTGATQSSNFPTTPGAFDTSHEASLFAFDVFVTKLDPTGATLVYSTFLEGNIPGFGFLDANEGGTGIAVDAAGNAYVTGGTTSTNFPTTPGAFDTSYNGGTDAFVTKLNPNGSALIYSAYLGGGFFEDGLGIAVDNAGVSYVTGFTRSANFPTTPGAFDRTVNSGPVDDAFVTKVNANGSGLVYSTFLGGSGDESGRGIAVDAAGNAYVTGFTNSGNLPSDNFPTTPGAFDRTFNGGASDVFVTRFSADGSTLVYSTFLGGSSTDESRGITVDASGAAFVTGFTSSSNFPTTPGAFDTTLAGAFDVFVTRLNETGSTALYSTYLGGDAGDAGEAIAIDASGSAYVTGATTSNNFPITPGAFQPTFVGFPSDAFVAKFSNRPPNATEDTATTDEDTPVTISVLANDADPDGASLTVTDVTQGANGSVVINPDNTVTYSPAPNFNGADSFTYTVSDGDGASDTATVTVTINPVNDPPVAVDVIAATDEDTSVQINLAATDIDSSNLNFVVVSGPMNGALGAVSGASVTYTPNANFSGNDIFTFKANDGTANSNVATVTIIVAPVNDPPEAANDSASTNEDAAVTINVLANDADVEGNTLTVTAASQGTNGAVTINPDSTVTYTPALNFFGSDSFTYTASDGAGASDTATVTITIDPVNDPPVAVDVSAATDEDVSVQINLTATDVDNSNLTFVVVSGPPNGALGVISGASVTYTPNANFNGSDTFTFKANDGAADSNIASVTITIAPVNDPPDAANDSTSTNEDTAVTINVLANDADVEGNTLSLTAVSQGANGAVTINPDGTVTYTPAPNFFGSDSFTYSVNDGAGGSDTATVNVNVTSVQDTPVANDDAATVAEDSGPNAINVLANDSDVDGDTLTVASVTQGAHGSVVNNGSSVSYTPAPNYFGLDSFTYTVSDGQGGVDTATVNVIVTSVNDAPVANGDVYNTNFNMPLAVPAPGVLGNDADVEGDALSAALVTNVSNGTLALASDGSFTYTPNPNFSGADSFSYRASDGTALSNVATVQVTVVGGGGASKIVFSSNRDGNFEIYSMNTDGTAQTRLTNHSATDLFPALSPDGTKIAFASNRDGLLNFELYVMNADGSSPARLTTNARVDGKPAWSPDGTKIAFTSARDGNFEIYSMNADGSGLARLTNNGAIDTDPTWSPDGTKIAFSSNRDGLLNFEIYVMNADGGGVTRLTNNSALDVSPAWSPDGTRIAFSSNRNGLLNFEVYVMNADGGAQTRLTINGAVDGEPAWSQDGARIVFTTNRDGGLNFEIYVMNADGSGQMRLTMNPAADVSPDW